MTFRGRLLIAASLAGGWGAVFGVPFTVVAGARGLERGVVEVRNRLTGVAAEVSLETLNEHLQTQLKTAISA